jgi:hypothetical protein
MSPEESIFAQYRGKKLLLDSNLLLLFLIGTFDRSLITRFRRTTTFAETDFDILANFVHFFRHLTTTPQLLTEVASLANSLHGRLKPFWHLHFKQEAASLFEMYTPSIELMNQSAFLEFGLADASVLVAATDSLVLTEDFRLSGFLRTQNLPVLNFRDILAMSKSSKSR